MVFLDSNIVIYLRDPTVSERIARQFHDQRLDTCNIIVAEVLGYNGLEQGDARYFENLFSAMKDHPFDSAVTNKVIELRQTRHIQLPDAIIAATAIVNKLVLWTHNAEDFLDIPGLQVFDPLGEKELD